MFQSTVDLFSKTREIKLCHAAKSGTLEALREILESNKVDVNHPGMNLRTALHESVRKGHAVCALLLLDCGASVDARDKNDETPLHLAVRSDFPDCVTLLMQYGANPNLRNLRHGDTPLHIAAEGGLLRCLKSLMEDYTAKSKTKSAISRRFSVSDHVGRTKKGERKHSTSYIAVDFGIRNNLGNTVLHVCCTGRGAWTKRNRLACAFLLENGAMGLVNCGNNAGETPLHIAAKWGSFGCAVLMLESGADPIVRDNEQNQPQHVILKELVLDYTVSPQVIRNLRQKLKAALDSDKVAYGTMPRSVSYDGALNSLTDSQEEECIEDMIHSSKQVSLEGDRANYRSSLMLPTGTQFKDLRWKEEGVSERPRSRSIPRSSSQPEELSKMLKLDEDLTLSGSPQDDDSERKMKACISEKKMRQQKEEEFFKREEKKQKRAYKKKVNLARHSVTISDEEVKVKVLFVPPLPPSFRKKKYFLFNLNMSVADAVSLVASRESLPNDAIYGLYLTPSSKRNREEGLWLDSDNLISTYGLQEKDTLEFKIRDQGHKRGSTGHRRASSWTAAALGEIKKEEEPADISLSVPVSVSHERPKSPRSFSVANLKSATFSKKEDSGSKFAQPPVTKAPSLDHVREGRKRSRKKKDDVQLSTSSEAITFNSREELEQLISERVNVALAPIHNKMCRMMNRAATRDADELEIPWSEDGVRPQDAHHIQTPRSGRDPMWIPSTLGELRWVQKANESVSRQIKETRIERLIAFYKIALERTSQTADVDVYHLKHQALLDFFIWGR